MSITVASARCILQIALLGSVTNNLRAVFTVININNYNIYFYYHEEPSEKEIDLSEIVSTEVICQYDDVSAEIIRSVIPEPEKIPLKENGIWVYHRYEEYLEDN
jgi:hypothetical protein